MYKQPANSMEQALNKQRSQRSKLDQMVMSASKKDDEPKIINFEETEVKEDYLKDESL